jgi:hypothetical protein
MLRDAQCASFVRTPPEAIGAVPLPSSQSTLLGRIGPPSSSFNRSGGSPVIGCCDPAVLERDDGPHRVRANSIPDLAKLDGTIRVVDDKVQRFRLGFER